MPELPFPDPLLADDVIRLRPWSRGDVDAACQATRDALIPRFTRVSENQTEEEILRFIETREPARRAGTVLPLVIADVRGDALLGTISLIGVHRDQRRGALGFWVAS